MTRSTLIIERALDHAMDKDPETLRIMIELTGEYRIAINQNLELEKAIKAFMKDGEKVLLESKRARESQRGTE
jgi:hypothetical protein